MKILMFDLENGSKTLGGKAEIQKMFGYPVLSPSSFEQFKAVIGQLYTNTMETKKQKVGSIEIEEEVRVIKPAGDNEIDVIVIDTFSELSKKFQRSLVNKEGKMMMNQWGKLKNTLDMLLEYITQVPGILVCNCHGKVQTMDDGTTKVLPYIDGSTKEDISKWFDFVIYTKTKNKSKDEVEYLWHTGHNSMYDHAKDRTQLLDAVILQDYQLIIDAAKKKGFDGAKILVIGSPGTGKTLSLRTLTGK